MSERAPRDVGRAAAAARFFKAHGHGNDYLVFFAGDAWEVTARAVRAVCHPHLGVGADGTVLVTATEPEIALRMFNPDGGEFERSGNGLRVAAAALYAQGLVGTEPFRVATAGGAATLTIHRPPAAGVFDVSAELGRAHVGPEAVALDASALTGEGIVHPTRGVLDVVPVSVGNPHLVVLTDDLTNDALADVGPFLSGHPGLALGANVQLVRWEASGPRIRIWERGVGPTAASGTSACAVVVAAVATGRRPPGAYAVEMDGGVFEVEVAADLVVTLRGPVQEICVGELSAGFLAGLAGA